jgi:hypothetical protein
LDAGVPRERRFHRSHAPHGAKPPADLSRRDERALAVEAFGHDVEVALVAYGGYGDVCDGADRAARLLVYVIERS